MYISLHVKYPLFLPDFNGTLIALTYFWKIFEYEISWKPMQWGPSCSTQTGGWTDRRHNEANSHFLQLSMCLKNYIC